MDRKQRSNGRGLSRREFLRRSRWIAVSPVAAPALLASAARSAPRDVDGRALVVIELNGGNDGLNTVIPFRDDRYVAARGKLAVAPDRVLKLTDELGFHPAMRGVARLFEQGWLTVVQGVGYPDPDRSHFRSLKIWHTAKLDPGRRDEELGWIGRSLDPLERRRGADAVFVGESRPPLSLRSRRAVTSTLLHAEDLELSVPVEPREAIEPAPMRAGDLGSFVHQNVADAYASAAELSDVLGRDRADASYGADPIGVRLARVAAMLRAGFGARVYYARHDGYDTHDHQAPVHERLLGELSRGLDAFFRDLASGGLAERVLVLVFSEFGRRLPANGSLGTDHGTAAPLFLVGPVTRPLFGESPDLGDLDPQGDPKATLDFRRLYATALSWIDVTPRFDGAFGPLPLLG